MVPDNFAKPAKFRGALVLLAELKGTVCCHLNDKAKSCSETTFILHTKHETLCFHIATNALGCFSRKDNST